MKKLVFKKWVEVLLMVIGFSGFFMVAAFEWNSILPYLLGIAMIMFATGMEAMYGRN